MRSALFDIAKIFCDHGYETTNYFTKSAGDATRVAAQYGLDYDLIVACGGDGTMNEVVSGILSLPEPRDFGYIPAGSTNDYAITLGFPTCVRRAAKIAVTNKAVPVDIGKFTAEGGIDRKFAYIASFGAFTKLSYNTPQHMKNQLGHTAYLIEGVLALKEVRPHRLRYTCDGKTEEGYFVFGAVMNTISLAGFYSFPSKDISLDDGLFDVILVRAPSNIFGYGGTLLDLARRKYNDNNIVFLHGKDIKFEFTEPTPFTLDGEYGGAVMAAKMENLPRMLNIIKPANTTVENRIIGTKRIVKKKTKK